MVICKYKQHKKLPINGMPFGLYVVQKVALREKIVAVSKFCQEENQ